MFTLYIFNLCVYNFQSTSLSYSTDYSTLTSNYFGTSTFCWYKFTPASYSIGSFNIMINSLSNANAEVYYESSTNSFSYKGSLTSGKSMNVDVSYYNPVWVLITPTASNAYASVKASASSSSSSSSSSTNLTSILVPVFVGGACCIGIIIFIIVCRYIRKRRMMQIYNSQAANMGLQAHPQMN